MGNNGLMRRQGELWETEEDSGGARGNYGRGGNYGR